MLSLKQPSQFLVVCMLVAVKLLQYEVSAVIHDSDRSNKISLSKHFHTEQHDLPKSVWEQRLQVYDPAVPIPKIEDGCGLCNNIINDFRKDIMPRGLIMPSDNINTHFEKLNWCSSKASLLERNTCNEVMRRRKEISRLITNGLSDNEICAMINGSCKHSIIKDSCTVCKAAAQYIGECIKYGNMSIEIIEAGAKIMCIAMEGQVVSKECDFIIDHIDDIIQWLENGFSADEICERLRICPKHDTLAVESSDPGRLCTICNIATDVIHASVELNQVSLNIVKQGLEKACSAMQNGREDCEQIIHRFEEILLYSRQDMQRGEICQKLGVCNIVPSEDTSCMTCEKVLEVTEARLKTDNRTITVVKQNIERVCSMLRLPQCNDVLKKIDEVVGSIVKGARPKEICEGTSMCKTKFISNKSFQDSPMCQTCEVVIKTIEKRVKQDNSTLEKLRKSIEEACHLVPSPQCDDFLKKFDTIAKWLESGKSPHEVCQKISLCSVSNRGMSKIPSCLICEIAVGATEEYIKVDNSTIPRLRESIQQVCDELPIPQCTDFLAKFDEVSGWLEKGVSPKKVCEDIAVCPNAIAPKLLTRNEDANCLLCEVTVEALELRLKEDNSTIENIRHSIEQACEVFPIPECSDFLKKFDEIAGWLEHGASPKKVCEDLSFCSKGKSGKSKGFNECDYCEVAVGAAEQYVKVNNATLPLLKNTIEQWCNEFPLPQCNSLLNKFNQVSGWIESGVSPKNVCEDALLCRKADTHQVTSLKGDPNCLLCEVAVEALEVRLKEDNSTLEKVRQSIEEACEVLPIPQCPDILKKFDEISGWLAHGESPKKICKSFSLCPDERLKNNEASKCLLCKIAAGSTEEYLKGNSMVLPRLRKIFEKLCEKLPLMERDASLAKFDEVSGWLQSGVSPDYICDDLAFCRQEEFPRKIPKCLICEVVIGAMEERLKFDNTTIPQLRKAIEDACAALPVPQCADFLNEFNEVAEWLTKGESPKEVCKKISVCPAFKKPEPSVKSDVCLMCVHATIAIEHSVKQDNSTLEMLKKAVEATCHAMPELPECHIIVKRFEQIASWLEDGKEPRAICSNIGLCQTSWNELWSQPLPTSKVSVLASNAEIE